MRSPGVGRSAVHGRFKATRSDHRAPGSDPQLTKRRRISWPQSGRCIRSSMKSSAALPSRPGTCRDQWERRADRSVKDWQRQRRDATPPVRDGSSERAMAGASSRSTPSVANNSSAVSEPISRQVPWPSSTGSMTANQPSAGFAGTRPFSDIRRTETVSEKQPFAWGFREHARHAASGIEHRHQSHCSASQTQHMSLSQRSAQRSCRIG